MAMVKRKQLKLFFSDFFDVSPALIEKHGAFDISLLSDLPLFIDPFLLFNSPKPEYKELHAAIISYIRFLKRKSEEGLINEGLVEAWFKFSEIRQTWLGFTFTENKGRGLGMKFARALHNNLSAIFSDFGQEQVTQGSHIEKLCLVEKGIGKDSISDFTTNLIHGHLLKFTESFAVQHIDPKFVEARTARKVRFNYQTESWEAASFKLPIFEGDYVLLLRGALFV